MANIRLSVLRTFVTAATLRQPQTKPPQGPTSGSQEAPEPQRHRQQLSNLIYHLSHTTFTVAPDNIRHLANRDQLYFATRLLHV